MEVKGFLVECGGPTCAALDPRRGRGRHENHGQTLGRVELRGDGDLSWNMALGVKADVAWTEENADIWPAMVFNVDPRHGWRASHL